MIWTLKNLVDLANRRRNDKFDFNIAVSGSRGDGKSSFLFKFFCRFDKFNPYKSQVYSRKDVIKLLENQKMGFIFDDEAIRSAYKRNFQDSDQKIYVQMLNMYRNNFNIYGLAIPSFYSLDKDLRALIKVHVHIIRRGFAVIHTARQGSLYSDDPWDIKYNKKLEEGWAKLSQKNPNFNPPYHKLTTFAGYLMFNDLTPKQRQIYEEIKESKRKIIYEEEMRVELGDKDTMKTMDPKTQAINNIMEKLKAGQVTKQQVQEYCTMTNLQYYNLMALINKRLANEGNPLRFSQLLKSPSSSSNNNNSKVIKDIDEVPIVL